MDSYNSWTDNVFLVGKNVQLSIQL